jgi:hypothetical protein
MGVQRLSCWFSFRERVAIQRESEKRQISLNAVVRASVQDHLNLDKPIVTEVTGNENDSTDDC